MIPAFSCSLLRPVLVATSLLTAAAMAGDWTRFRGEDGSGVDVLPGLPVDRLEEQTSWTAAIEGISHSSPVVFGNRLIYTTLVEGEEDRRAVVCRSTRDGEVLWKRDFPFTSHHTHAFNSFATSTPAVDADHVYIWWSHAVSTEVLAFDHEGDLTWRVDLGPFESQHGSGSSLVVVEGIVIVQKENLGPESFIVGLGAPDGAEVWKHRLTGTKTPYVTPTIRRAADGRAEAVFSSTTNGIFGLDPKSGELLWKADPAFTQRCVASPVAMGEDLLFASCGQGSGGTQSVVLRCVPRGSTAEVVYQIDKGLSYVPTPVFYEGMLFIVSDGGIGQCIDAKTGKVHWRERLVRNCFASPVCINGHLYVFSREGEYVVVRAAADFEKAGDGDIGGPVHATPALGDDKMFIKTDKRILCIPGKGTV